MTIGKEIVGSCVVALNIDFCLKLIGTNPRGASSSTGEVEMLPNLIRCQLAYDHCGRRFLKSCSHDAKTGPVSQCIIPSISQFCAVIGHGTTATQKIRLQKGGKGVGPGLGNYNNL